MKCSVCCKEFEKFPTCPTCYATKVIEASPPLIPSTFEIEQDIKMIKEKLDILFEAVMTKKGIKNIKKSKCALKINTKINPITGEIIRIE